MVVSSVLILEAELQVKRSSKPARISSIGCPYTPTRLDWGASIIARLVTLMIGLDSTGCDNYRLQGKVDMSFFMGKGFSLWHIGASGPFGVPGHIDDWLCLVTFNYR
jgi:hypothetical protein